MGVAFRELPVGRSQLRLSQSRDRGLQGSTHCGNCVHGSHLLPIDPDRREGSRPATRCAIGIAPVAVSLSNAPPTATPANAKSRITAGVQPRSEREARLSVRSGVAFFHREAALSSLDDRPESEAFHLVPGGASPTVLECAARHPDTVLLLGQLGQLLIDHRASGLPPAHDEMLDLSQ